MRKASVLLAVLVMTVLVGCQQETRIEIEETAEVDVEAEMAAVKALLENYVTSVQNEDLDLYARNVAGDADMVNFGVFGDPIVGWEELKEVIENQNAGLFQTKITVSDLKIHVADAGDVAWATSTWNFTAMMGENPVELPVRCTWVCEKRAGVWVVAHFHKSVAS